MSKGSCAWDHSVITAGAKHRPLFFTAIPPPHPSPLLFLPSDHAALNYCLPISSSSSFVLPLLSVLFHLTFCVHLTDRSGSFSSPLSLNYPLSPSLFSLPFRSSVVLWLCRNSSSNSNPLINSPMIHALSFSSLLSNPHLLLPSTSIRRAPFSHFLHDSAEHPIARTSPVSLSMYPS